VLTHCNAGSLGNRGIWDCVGGDSVCCRGRKNVSVIATETRPLLQGSRLTAFELSRDKIPSG